MHPLEEPLDEIARRTDFSGVISLDRDGTIEFARAYGMADRAHGIATTIDTQFGLASGTKGFTALAVMSLVGDGALLLFQCARRVIGNPCGPTDSRGSWARAARLPRPRAGARRGSVTPGEAIEVVALSRRMVHAVTA